MMRRAVCFALAVALLVGGTVTADASHVERRAAGLTNSRFESEDPRFSRDYLVYVPASVAATTKRVPLVVYLHGCSQNAAEAAAGTRWPEEADEHGFIVVFPDQEIGKDVGTDPDSLTDRTRRSAEGTANGAGCWNWFRPESQQRGAGEPQTIAGITEAVIDALHIDPRRVYIAGASAGADMAVIMGATYPDLYAAIGVFAGCAYLTCTDTTGEAAYGAMGGSARPMPVFAVQGTADHLNSYPLGAGMVRQWIGTNDLADNGQADGSVPSEPASSVGHGVDGSALAGVGTVGDLCVRNRNWPCLGGALGLDDYPYTVELYNDAGGESLIEFWTVHGAGHAYLRDEPVDGQASPPQTWTDPRGPGITDGAWRFFAAHPRGGRL